MTEEKIEKFCSKCGSTKIRVVQSPAKIHSSLFQEYSCNECSHEGMVLEGSSKFIEEFKKKLGDEK